jgi:hypothetical protein
MVLEVESLYSPAMVTFGSTLDPMRARDPESLRRGEAFNALALEQVVPVCDLIDYPMYLHADDLKWVDMARTEIRRLRTMTDTPLLVRFWHKCRKAGADDLEAKDWTTELSLPVWRAGWDMLHAELRDDDIAAVYCEGQPGEWKPEAPWWTEFLSRAGD